VATTFPVFMQGPVPNTGMKGALLHVVTLNATGTGYLQVWNPDQGQPVSSLNQIVPTTVVGDAAYVPISSSGNIGIYSTVTTDVIIEIEGWTG